MPARSVSKSCRIFYLYPESCMQEIFYILIAEDDEDDQMLLKAAFSEVQNTAKLVFVENGIELINHFRSFEEGRIAVLPSLLIVDLNMPKKNGREAIRELAEKDYFRKFPTVIFSTTGSEFERERCKQLGISDFFVKPSNFQLLTQMVRQFRDMALPVI
jgi:CheY-like chemotaxis protein